jgi:hypothetical protein
MHKTGKVLAIALAVSHQFPTEEVQVYLRSDHVGRLVDNLLLGL